MIARANHPLALIKRVVLNISDHALVQRASLVEMPSSVVTLDAGEVVALVTWNDSSSWSVLTDIATAYAKESPSGPVEMMSAISSHQALAAVRSAALTRTGGTLTLGEGALVGAALGSFSQHLEGLELWCGGPLSYLATVGRPAERTCS